jgi:monoamine oxidase
MKDADIIIIGGGISGLLAGRELARSGKRVIILEARNRIGGRIHTVDDPSFELPVELGAEFVHGDLPLTLHLLKEAGIKYYPVKGRMVQLVDGKLTDQNIFNEHNQMLVMRLKELENDMTVNDFLETYFGDQRYIRLKNTIKGFVQGYDAADTQRASTFAFRNEWLKEDDWIQYRIDGGYKRLSDFLGKEFEKEGGRVILKEVVRDIVWKPGHAEIISKQNTRYAASAVIVTVPLGILSTGEGYNGHIRFTPSIPEKIKAVHAMGFGSVIKIVLRFEESFWESDAIEKNAGTNMENVGFIFSDATVPTWWTQFPKHASMLTGWLAGPNAAQFKTSSEEDILTAALNSLSSILKTDHVMLKKKLIKYHVANWIVDPFAQGAYTYETPETKKARMTLQKPLDDTLFFSGEALYDGEYTGTVEAALASGLDVVKQITTS